MKDRGQAENNAIPKKKGMLEVPVGGRSKGVKEGRKERGTEGTKNMHASAEAPRDRSHSSTISVI